MVVAGLEQDVEALHAPQPDDRVAERELERVAEVQLAGHVGRRVRVDVRRPRRVGVGVVEAFVLPDALPTLLDALRTVERLHLHQEPILASKRAGNPMWSGSDYVRSMPNRLDRLLVAALAVLVVAGAADALRHRHHARMPAPPAVTTEAALPRAPVPARVRLVPSTTAFLPRCANSSIQLDRRPGAGRHAPLRGRPCHVPPLHLRAVLRTADGRVAYAGPALAYEDLSGNYAGEGVSHGRLLGACRAGAATATVSGSGLSASGAIRCRTG